MQPGKASGHDHHLHHHITGDAQIIRVGHLMHRTDDPAKQKYMYERMMGGKISRRHLQPFFLRIINKKTGVHRKQHRQPAQQQEEKDQQIRIFNRLYGRRREPDMLRQPVLALFDPAQKIPELPHQNGKKAGQHRQGDPQPPVLEIHIAHRVKPDAKKHCRRKQKRQYAADQPSPPVMPVNGVQGSSDRIDTQQPDKDRKNAVGKSQHIFFQIQHLRKA